MDHFLSKRGLYVGIICFCIALIGLFLIDSWVDWRLSHPKIIMVDNNPKIDPTANRDVFPTSVTLIMFEMIALPILAGAYMGWISTTRKANKKDMMLSAGIAGATMFILLSLVFWPWFILNQISTTNIQYSYTQLLVGLAGVVTNVIIILAAAIISVVTSRTTLSLTNILRVLQGATVSYLYT